MKFEVNRKSFRHMSKEFNRKTQPMKGAVFNAIKDRWEVNIRSLRQIMKLDEDVKIQQPLLPFGECGELPNLIIFDEFESGI